MGCVTPCYPCECVEEVGCRQVIGQQVHVGRHREAGAVVAEPELHLDAVQAVAEQHRRARVRKVWKPAQGNPAAFAVGLSTRE